MYRNNDFIYEAISNLEKLINIPIEIDSSRPKYDALLRIKNEQFIVEAKKTVRTSNQGLIMSKLEDAKQYSNRPIILIAEYISKKATEELKERKINYLDTAGNAFIKCNELIILIEGQKKAKKAERLAKEGIEKKEEPKEQALDTSKPLSLEAITNPDKE